MVRKARCDLTPVYLSNLIPLFSGLAQGILQRYACVPS